MSHERGHWALLRPLVAGGADDPFLDQLRVIQTPWFGIYLHVIHRPDEPHPHDHPWAFASLVLAGAYRELVYPDKHDRDHWRIRDRPRFSAGRIPLHSAHQITEMTDSVWTLVLTGPERNPSWGFYPDGKFVPWRTYQDR